MRVQQSLSMMDFSFFPSQQDLAIKQVAEQLGGTFKKDHKTYHKNATHKIL